MRSLLTRLSSSLTQVLKREKHGKVRIVQDEKQELLIRLGREQFQKLLDKGLNIPVMML